MNVVHKYPLNFISSEVVVQMPRAAEILNVDVQRGVTCLWALVDASEPNETRKFLIRGTGHEVPTGVHHIGSFLMEDGAYVFHVFEENR